MRRTSRKLGKEDRITRDASDRARAREILGRAADILVLTGAGISADSGVPTFRGKAGLWRRHRPEELATPEAFARDPRLVWEWYAWRRDLVARCRPNAAHRALARWALRRPGVRIVTQNVDGLHGLAAEEAAAEAGAAERPAAESDTATPTRDVATAVAAARAFPLELHGSLFRARCTGCGQRMAHREPVDAGAPETLPHCPGCVALLRPDVVWFGESLPQAVIAEAAAAAERAQACLVVGTSAVVYPAAGLAGAVAARGGALVEVNPEETPLTARATVSLRAGAAEAVPNLLEDG